MAMPHVADIDKCDECGEVLPALALGKICRSCLYRRSWRVALEREREIWDGKVRKVMLSREKGNISHLVMVNDPDLTYCGHKPTETRRRRLAVYPAELDSSSICETCRAALARVRVNGGNTI
jgi:hypothetical protein